MPTDPEDVVLNQITITHVLKQDGRRVLNIATPAETEDLHDLLVMLRRAEHALIGQLDAVEGP